MSEWKRSSVVSVLAAALIASACVPGTYVVGPGGGVVATTPGVVLESGTPPPAVEVTVAPPPVQVEVVPPPQPGQLWIYGRWNWAGGRWAWQGGYWRPQRAGYSYYPGQWVVRTPGRYAYVPGFYRPATKPPPRTVYRPYYPSANVQIYRP